MPVELIQALLRVIDKLLMFLAISPIDPVLTTPVSKSLLGRSHDVISTAPAMRSLDDLKKEVVQQFLSPCNVRRMKFMSSCLRREYLAKLQSSQACMLPSFCHALPTGKESGTFVALDVGGSTFRIAIVELSNRSEFHGGMAIKHMSVNKIDEPVRKLSSADFFDWMARRIQKTFQQVGTFDLSQEEKKAIPLGLVWSFPLEQTSYRSGKLQSMGKGFRCHEGAIGQDLGHLIEEACRKRGLAIQVDAIINDSSATLLSQSYMEPATSMALILGTGINSAVYLPVFSIGTEKYGQRDTTWFERAEKVIVNTELSMFGKGILPESRWDQDLNRDHPIPDFQPLEYMTTGRYLGEIFRLILVEAVNTCGLFGGVLPTSIRDAYSLDTALLATIEEDTTVDLHVSAITIQQVLELEDLPNLSESKFCRGVVEAISRRAAAYIATSLHALWSVQKETETNPTISGISKTSIASNGAVILKYPGFRERCQTYISQLINDGSADILCSTIEQVFLEPTGEATVLGAAVAVAMAQAT